MSGSQVTIKRFVTEEVYAVVKISMSFPKDQESLAEALGIRAEERANLIGQDLLYFKALLGNSDEA